MYQHESFKEPNLLTGVNAGANLSAKLYYAVQYDSNGDVVLYDGTGTLLGFLMNKPEEDISAEVAVIGGGALGIADGSISFGDKLTVTTAGKVKLATISDPVYAIAMANATDGNAVAILPISLAQAGRIITYLSTAGSGGGVSEALTVTGLLSTDTIIAVSQEVEGANATSITGFNTQIDDGLTVTYTADPGAGSEVRVTVLR